MKPFRATKSARNKVTDYLAHRNYSELELRRKLELYFAEQPELLATIDDAIEFAKESGAMAAPSDLSEEVTRQLGRRKKSHRYIEHTLRSKGLPPAAKDPELELQKARELVHSKLDKDAQFDYEEKKKIHRLLMNRGFDLDTIKKVMDTKNEKHD